MNKEITAELIGLLRGALACAERARVMAIDVHRPKAADAIVKAGHALLMSIHALEADAEAGIAIEQNRDKSKENAA